MDRWQDYKLLSTGVKKSPECLTLGGQYLNNRYLHIAGCTSRRNNLMPVSFAHHDIAHFDKFSVSIMRHFSISFLYASAFPREWFSASPHFFPAGATTVVAAGIKSPTTGVITAAVPVEPAAALKTS